MSMKRVAVSFALAVAASTAAAVNFAARQNSPLKVQNKVQLAALPFPLRDVRLLDGPFREAIGRPHSFDVLVDGEKIATQTLEIHPGELFDFEYPLPEQLTRGKERITVKFQSRPNAMAGSVFDVRVAQLERGEK
jgi:hypothetical protein